jgi:Ca2+-binding RTX toxin-like protein
VAGISGTGNTAANNVVGNTAANLLSGLAGNDTLDGGTGNDTLAGGLGADRLTGGTGADAIRYASAAEGGDTILSYSGLEDSIEVSAAGFGGGLVAGMNLVATGRYAQNATGQATSAAGVGQFVLETDTGLLWWDADGSGAGVGVVIAGIAGAANWAGTEITLVA